MKILMHLCLNLLLVFAMTGVAKSIQPAFSRFGKRYQAGLTFLVALVVMLGLLTGLIVGAFNE